MSDNSSAAVAAPLVAGRTASPAMRPGVDIGIAREAAERRERYGHHAYRAPGGPPLPKANPIDLQTAEIQARIDKRKEEIVAAYVEAEAQKLARLEMAARMEAKFAKRVPVDRVLAIASEVTEVSVSIMQGSTRNRPHAWPRHFAMWLLREVRWDLSLPQIGKAFGGRDHTTAMHALKNAESKRDLPPFRAWVADPRTQALIQTRGEK